MKIKKYIYVLRDRYIDSRPFVNDVLHDTPNDFSHFTRLGLDVIRVITVNIDLSSNGRAKSDLEEDFTL